jgi:hypothetical protein
LPSIGWQSPCRRQNMNLVTSVMQAAATEALQEEVDQIDLEVQRLLVEMERASVGENRGGRFTQRFLVLLKRRGDVARKALLLCGAKF